MPSTWIIRLLETPVRQLSGGEQRRLSLLRAIAVEPDYLIMDEVTSGLDLISTDAVLTLVGELCKVIWQLLYFHYA